jgi:hypothetical protein
MYVCMYIYKQTDRQTDRQTDIIADIITFTSLVSLRFFICSVCVFVYT